MTEALARAAEPLAALAPTAGGRARLLEALAGPERFRSFFAALVRHFDLTVETIRALLARIDDPSAWQASAAPWIKLIHFSGGPALGTADAGFVRVSAGTRFPRHRHEGPELTFVLEGGMSDGTRRYGPGDTLAVTAGDVHEFLIEPEADLVVMVWHNGITPLHD
jgi:hypothetical protein